MAGLQSGQVRVGRMICHYQPTLWATDSIASIAKRRPLLKVRITTNCVPGTGQNFPQLQSWRPNTNVGSAAPDLMQRGLTIRKPANDTFRSSPLFLRNCQLANRTDEHSMMPVLHLPEADLKAYNRAYPAGQ